MLGGKVEISKLTTVIVNNDEKRETMEGGESRGKSINK